MFSNANFPNMFDTVTIGRNGATIAAIVTLSVVSMCALLLRGEHRPKKASGETVTSQRVLVATRIHKAYPSAKMVSIEKVMDFVESQATDVQAILICVGIDDNSADKYLARLKTALADNQRVVIQHVKPWGRFVHALNAAVLYAKINRFSVVQFTSLETRLSDRARHTLLEHLGDDVLVAGAVLPGHEYRPESKGALPLTGRSCPWNTAAVWDVSKLGVTGFPPIGEGNADVPGGVEEVSAITIRQLVDPVGSKAVLVAVPDMSWETDNFESEERRHWHEQKMASKDERPRLQLEHAGLAAGSVWHL